MISVESLGARVGDFELRDVTFEVPRGAWGVVIGAAGSGKTTLLETIAGLVPQRTGRTRIGGVDVTTAAPETRDIGLVYQHGYLFPHLTVAENVGYGAHSADLARELLDRLDAAALEKRHVRSLSGGERQIVAIARALARRPGVVLLDEPFNALDPRRRTAVRRELRAMHRERGFTVLQVTHDFTEAGLLGDVAVLLDAGRVLQSGKPADVFRKPASSYVAEFLGAENVFAGEARVLSPQTGDEPATIEFHAGALVLHAIGSVAERNGYAVVRAEEIVLSAEPPAGSARNCFQGVVSEVAITGALTRVTLDVSGVPVVAALTSRSAADLGVAPGAKFWASFKAMAVHLC